MPSYFHVFNRAAHRHCLFETPDDFAAFFRAVADAQRRNPVPIVECCVMPNHFHFVIGPTVTRTLSAFMHRVTVTHSKRWQENRDVRGNGPVYQGRFKAVLIKDDAHFTTVCRYVAQNPVEAGLVETAERWPWSSFGLDDRRNCHGITLGVWPFPK